MECPFIKRDTIPDPVFNEAINYKDLGGSVDYVFYDHDDGFGKITRVQFCRLIGRKHDVFECLNESEWRQCGHFLLHSALLDAQAFPCPECGGEVGHKPNCPDGIAFIN